MSMKAKQMIDRSRWQVALMLMMGVLTFSGCHKETVTLQMGAQLEQPKYYDESVSDAKTYLSQEEYIYWESGDSIAVSKKHDNVTIVALTSGVNRQEAYFELELQSGDESNPMVAVYPASASALESGGSSNGQRLLYPATMPYRTADAGVDPDLTFGKNCFPMVAYATKDNGHGDYDDNRTFGFHAVSGIVRFQLFSSDVVEGKTVSSIDLISYPSAGSSYRQLSGAFTIRDINSNRPYLSPADAPSAEGDATAKITITNINQAIGHEAKSVGGQNGLLTFYVPLPALCGSANEQYPDNYVSYRLRMVVHANDGTKAEKIMNCKIRRNSIMKMPALDITGWVTDASADHGTLNVALVGNGTPLRPFQIYDTADLRKLRTAYNTNRSEARINGQRITKDTWIKVVRTDIVLDDANWTEPIHDFVGHFSCSSGNPVTAGIVNNSSTPLFDVISVDGYVDSVTVRSSQTVNYTSGTAFSPLCRTNRGHISNCVNQVNINASSANIAGLCITNEGTLHGCRNESLLSTDATHNVAGICLDNQGTVMACVLLERARLNGGQVAGIAHKNQGVVQQCYATLSTLVATGNWGGIVYNNTNTGNVYACYVMGNLLTQGSFGGMVNTNSGYVITCRNLMHTLSGLNYVGGLVGTMTDGEMRNCFIGNESCNITTGTGSVSVGGMVGKLSGGSVLNSYSLARVSLGHTQSNGSHVGGAVGSMSGGTVQVVYVYDELSKTFCGSYTAGTLAACYAYDAQASMVQSIVKDNGTLKVGDSTLSSVLQTQQGVCLGSESRYLQWNNSGIPGLITNAK